MLWSVGGVEVGRNAVWYFTMSSIIRVTSQCSWRQQLGGNIIGGSPGGGQSAGREGDLSQTVRPLGGRKNSMGL